jgi:hypothetical protein
MSNTKDPSGTIVHEIRWSEALPWWLLFRAAAAAFSPTVIVLAALGALATWAGWSVADQLGLLQREHVDLFGVQALKIRQGDLGVVLRAQRLEAALGQAALQRHLAAFEAHLVEATGTRLLALVATSRGLAQPRADTATDAPPRALGAGRRFDRIEFHVRSRWGLGAHSTCTR